MEYFFFLILAAIIRLEPMHHKIKKLFIGKIASVLLLLLPVQFIQAETIAVPLKIPFPLLNKLVVSQLFNNDSVSTELLNDPSGCSEISLSDPKLSELDHHLQINLRLTAKLAANVMGQCQPLLAWDGYIRIISDPIIKTDNPHLIYLQVIDSELTNLNNERLTSGPLWDQAKRLVHPLFDQFRLDLAPSISELKKFLPLFLTKHSEVQLNEMLASMHLAPLQVTTDGIQSALVFDVATITEPQQPEQALTQQEQLQWQEKWQSMDALLTHSIKHYAAATRLDDLKLTLFDILMDARYGLQDALQQDQANDPVRHWFINSWTQLIPVVSQISEENPQYATLALMTIVTATDALQALDKLGPTFGLDISTDGLRRLARMLNNSDDMDLLKYDEAIDPELQRLFQLQLNPENDTHSQPTWKFWPIRSAMAANNRQLDSWVPAPQELDYYLSSVRTLLLNSARQTLAKSTLTPQQQRVFKKLLLATAWQESCWRQYIVKKNKIVPISSSTGDIGIMQINEKVWRGFVDPHKLRWDFAYNVNSGSEILLNYMTRNAITNAEHKQHGGIDNLARATYSAYNGGPGKVSRYRSNKVSKEHRKIDAAFYDKYLKVKQGQEMAVAQCLGGNITIKTDSQQPKKNVKPIIKPQPRPVAATKPIIHDEAWVKQQDINHFTLQLGVFSSSQSAKNFIRQQEINGNYAVYQKRTNKQLQYGVIYGRYTTHQGAENESAYFKHVKPWIRPYEAIRESINP
jgi:septal ring-binding cell division protein DamX